MTNSAPTNQSPPAIIYRQAALRRLSSPQQSDHFLAVASPASWLVLVAAVLILAGAGVWSWKASITRTASGDGILIGAGGLISINTPGGGQVVDLRVKPGDIVRPDQVIAQIGNPLLVQQVHLAELALAEAKLEADRSITVRSAAARLEMEANDGQRRNLEREITELESQAIFAAEQIDNQGKLFAEGLTIKSTLVAAQQKLVDIRAEIARHRTQISQLEAQHSNSQASLEAVSAEARERIGGLTRRVAELREQLSQTTFAISPLGGQVIEIKVYPGATVNSGTPIATIQSTENALEALVYVSSKQAKHVLPGMEVQLLPSSTRPEEYGYVRGTVVTVAAFPVSPVAVLRRFENEALTSAITGQGPVTEVRVAIRRDPIQGGYEWSSRKGPGRTLSSGTLCGARIVTAKQRPLTLAVPLVKEALGLNR